MPQQVIGDVLRKGEEMFQSMSGKLLERPALAKAFEAAMVGKSKVDQGVALALKRMNVQTRSEFRGLKSRVEHLEIQVAQLQEALAALEPKPFAVKPRARKGAKRG